MASLVDSTASVAVVKYTIITRGGHNCGTIVRKDDAFMYRQRREGAGTPARSEGAACGSENEVKECGKCSVFFGSWPGGFEKIRLNENDEYAWGE